MEELEIKSKDTGCDSQIFSSELEYFRIIRLLALVFCCNKIILVFKIEKHLYSVTKLFWKICKSSEL